MRTITSSRERHIRVPRTARYHVLGEPASAREVWFVVHGYRQLAERFIRRFSELPGLGATRAVVAPEALSRFYIEDEVGPHGPDTRVGASWMTRADREYEIRDYVEYLDRLSGALRTDAHAGASASVVPPVAGPREARSQRVVVLGFSQGAETASRWVTYGQVRPDELVLWGGGLAADLDAAPATAALRRTAVRLVVGTEDSWAGRRAGESERQMRDLGLEAPERIQYPGGHLIPAATLAEHWPAWPDWEGAGPGPAGERTDADAGKTAP